LISKYEQRNVQWFGVEYINGDQQRRSAVICY